MQKLPDYIIYDELKREREKREEESRPRVYIPVHDPHYYHRDTVEEKEEDTQGMEVFKM